MAVYSNKNVVYDLMNEFIIALENDLHDNLRAVILFGSYARGDYETDSDIDVCILLTNVSQDATRRVRRLASRVGLRYDTMVSSFIMDVKTFERYKHIEPIYKNILEDGYFYYDAN